MTREQIEAQARALSFLGERYLEDLKLELVESLPSPVYGFDTTSWHLFAVVESTPKRLGATEHFAVNRITGEVRSLGLLGQ